MSVQFPVEYFEPNKEIPYKPEDLNVGIYLEVESKNRGIMDGEDYRGEVVIGEKPIDFFKGENGVLTTSYTDITVMELRNGGHVESIGIESINIKYNSWYFPEINIKFVDVRGNSIFNPYETTNDPESKEYAKKPFLSCFFSFPYPVFKLTVKGYYGKPVTYRLTVKDVRSQFNASTGNFELNANFIGYMYSYMTDVPMRMLFAAPYIAYDGVSSDLGQFTSGESKGQAIPTFMEFISDMAQAARNSGNNQILTDAKHKLQLYESTLNLLDNIKDKYLALKNYLNENFQVSEVKDNKVDITYIPNDKNSAEDVANNLNLYYRMLQNNWKQVCDNIDNSVSISINGGKEEFISYGSLVIMLENVDDANEFRSFPNNNDHIKTILKKDKVTPNKIGIYFNYELDKKTVISVREKIDNLRETAKSEEESATRNYYESALNWCPTLRSVFEMTLAHLHKFYENMERCIDNIHQSGDERVLSNIKVDTDCNAHSKNITVYPFPAFYDKDNKFMWIGNVDGAYNYSERELVEKVVNGVKTSKEEIEKVLTEYDTNQETAETFPRAGIPTLLYDLNRYKSAYNIGTDIVSSNEGNDIPLGVKILIKRMLLRKLFNSNVDKDKVTTMIDAETFGELEALNFLNAVSNLDSIRNEIFFDPKFGNRTKIMEYIQRNVISWFGGAMQNVEFIDNSFYWEKYHIVDDKLKNDGGLKEVDQDIDEFYYKGKGYFKNSLELYSDNEFIERMDSTLQYVNSDTYNKVFSLKTTPEELYLLKLQNNTKGGLLSDTTNYNDIIESGIVDGLSRKYFTDKQTLKPISLGDFDYNKEDIDFYPIFKGSANDYTQKTLQEQVTKRKTWWANVFNTDKDSEYHYSFSCKKYWDVSREDIKWSDIESDDLCEQIVQDFFRSLGMNISYINYFERIRQMEARGIVRIPMLEYMFLGYIAKKQRSSSSNESSIPSEGNLYSPYELDTFIKSEKYFEDHYRGLARYLYDNVLNDKIYDKETVDDLVIFTSENKKHQYFVRRLSDTTKEKLYTLFNETICLYNLHGAYSGHNINGYGTIDTDFETEVILSKFFGKINEMCGLPVVEQPIEPKPIEDGNVNVPVKLGVYNVMKNLYDRWKFGAYRSEGGSIHANETNITIKNFVFRNVFNEDIGDDYLFNVDKFIKLIDSIAKGDSDMSVYSFLFEICGIADCMMLCLPVNIFEEVNSYDNLRLMFTPHHYVTAKNDALQTTYIVTLRNKDSEHLSFQPNVSEFADDGVDFVNYNVTASSLGDNKLGVFGITYGLNDQHYFKDIKVSMDKPKVTEQSIASMMQIVENHKSGSNEVGRIHHDLYDTYSAHSYSCSVDMMGNAQIMPMLYFQLNNIPMFKGGYIIVNVEHTINNQGMTTTFTGNRISKYQFNLKEKGLEFNVHDKDRDNSAAITPTISEQKGGLGDKSNSENLNYSKETTRILIDAGHVYTTPGKESPTLYAETEMFANDNPERQGDGILNPYDIYRNEVYRYREYWGARKIAAQLCQKLNSAGYKAELLVHLNKDAKDKHSDFSKYVNDIYVEQKEKGHSTIIISIHSDAASNSGWGTGNRWIIYKQSPLFVESANEGNGKLVTPPHMDTSALLAECIAKAASEEFGKNKNIIPKVTKSSGREESVSVHTVPKTFAVERNGRTKDGIRPTTFSLAPTILSENLFHDTKSHVKFLASKEGRDIIVNLHYNGIEEFFRKVKKPKK